MKKSEKLLILSVLIMLFFACGKDDDGGGSANKIINHSCTDLSKIPMDYIVEARTSLRIAYWHSGIGGQILGGMHYLDGFKGSLYDYSDDLSDQVLYITDQRLDGANNLGNPDYEAWETVTRAFLDTNTIVNVIMWAWEDQVSEATSSEISTYLNLMTGLEADYPDIKFIYMTGRLDGTSLSDNLHLRNEEIRKYCKEHDKYLYDFADIDSYDPDGNYYGDKLADNACNYDADKDGKLETIGPNEETDWLVLPADNDKNWAIDWQNSHLEDVYWYDCYANETQPLNANQKAYAAWWLWARLAGWNGK